MSEPIMTLESMQADHLRWGESYAKWHQDISCWQTEHESAAARLAQLQQAMRDHGDALTTHLVAVNHAQQGCAKHERQIAEFKAGTSTVPQDVASIHHREQAENFAKQQEAHERIRKHHEAVMAQLQALEASAAAAM